MEIIKGLENIPSSQREIAVAMGNFDGVHLGHQEILSCLCERAQNKDQDAFVLTFSPHPGKIIDSGKIKLIQTENQKLREIERFCVKTTILIPFNTSLAALSAYDFIRKLLASLKIKTIVVGENFRFGKNREGSKQTLITHASEFGYEVFALPSLLMLGKIVSSSLIRDLIVKGQVEEVREMIGRPYSIDGQVVKGESRGNGLGFPTANIQPENELLPQGVFISTIKISDEKYPSVTNVGIRPTFADSTTRIETFILDFKGDVYGSDISLQFLKKIREEKKFKTVEELKKQLEKDVFLAKKYFEGLDSSRK